MKYGVYLPNYGENADVGLFVELAHVAEQSGWDGFFLWDHLLVSTSKPPPVFDVWVTLAAIAASTQRIRIGTTVTPVARRRPWQLARETVTLDHLSNGRVTLGVGLGAPADAEFAHFGEDPDPGVRAARLDEGLEILAGLWRGEPFKFKGQHYQVKKTTFRPATLQKPRIPVWVGGFWPNKRPFRRAARWDGVFPLKSGGRLVPEDLVEILAYIRKYRAGDTPLDVIAMGITPGDQPAKAHATVADYAAAGATWWLEGMYSRYKDPDKMLARIVKGPPTID